MWLARRDVVSYYCTCTLSCKTMLRYDYLNTTMALRSSDQYHAPSTRQVLLERGLCASWRLHAFSRACKPPIYTPHVWGPIAWGPRSKDTINGAPSPALFARMNRMRDYYYRRGFSWRSTMRYVLNPRSSGRVLVSKDGLRAWSSH